MSVDFVAAIIFVVLAGLFLWLKRSRVEIQGVFPLLYVLMYRSSFGLASMYRLAARFPRFFRVMGWLGVVVGFLGMAAVGAQLVWSAVSLLLKPGVAPAFQPVLPIEAKGVFFVPFSYWLVSIFLIALVHEFAHGVMANVYKMPVKSSGFAFLSVFLPVIPAAFVEPDERVVSRKPYREQLAVFAAGPFSNVVFALLMLGVLVLFSPLLSATLVQEGLEVREASGPALDAGLQKGDILLETNGVLLNSSDSLSRALNLSSPGDSVVLQLKDRSVNVTLGSNPQNVLRAFIGVKVAPHIVGRQDFVERYGSFAPHALRWLGGLFFILFALNIGIGLFNLLPIGPLDGGRMFQLVCLSLFKKNGLKVWSYTSMFFVLLIVVNLLSGLVR